MSTYERWRGSGWSPPPRAQRVAEYQAYLGSPEWKRIREEAMERDGSACAACGAEDDLEVHHLVYSYPRTLERSWDLLTLCREHHRYVHERIRPDQGASRKMATRMALDALGLEYRPPWMKPRWVTEETRVGHEWVVVGEVLSRKDWLGERILERRPARDAG